MSMGVGGKKLLPIEVTGVMVSDLYRTLKKPLDGFQMKRESYKT